MLRGLIRAGLVRHLLIALSIVSLVAVDTQPAFAAKPKKKNPRAPSGVQVDNSDVFKINVSIKAGKKTKSMSVSCLDKTPGEAKAAGLKTLFTSYATLIKKNQKNPRAKAKVALYQKLQKAGKAGCLEPDFLSLDPYRGTFGANEARTLYDRFAFGTDAATINAAAAQGLDRTVNQLTTANSDVGFDIVLDELHCDGYLADDSRNENPDPTKCIPGNENDVDFDGLRYDLYNRMWNSSNAFFYRFLFFLHDERMATAPTDNLDGRLYHTFDDHVKMLKRAAFSGDYVQFLRDWSSDYGHLTWLSGSTNRGDGPNENYGREFWELGTVGPTALDGSPVYSDLDISQIALAFSGWYYTTAEKTDNAGKKYNTLEATTSKARHAAGPQTIFRGTPYEKQVNTKGDVQSAMEEVLQATIAHPRLAEHLAEDLWKEYINPFATPSAIRRLAQIIRENNYQLIPVMRRIMASRALYASRSRKTLIKHPLELVFGFLRTTGIPILDAKRIDNTSQKIITDNNKFELLEANMLGSLNQKVLQPPSVFGWYEERLAGELYILPWRNAVVWLLNQDPNTIKAVTGFDYGDRFMSGLTLANAGTGVADRLIAELNLDFNAEQRAQLVQYLNYDLVKCDDKDKKDPTLSCNALGYRVKSNPLDPDMSVRAETVRKVRAALAMLAQLPDYRLK